MRRKWLNAFAFILLFLTISVISAFADDKLPVGSKAPDFSLPVIGSDKSISISDYINKKIVIVHFWKSR